MSLKRAVLTVILAASALSFAAASAHAGAGIVYSARYYYPPGDKRTSHFHIYRIDPDGRHRRQLTFGQFDDEFPTWSPDGKRIAFARCLPPWGISARVCILTLSTGHIQILTTRDYYSDARLRWIDSTHVALRTDKAVRICDVRTGAGVDRPEVPTVTYSPNRRHRCVQTNSGAKIVDTSEHEVDIKVSLSKPCCWLDNRTLVSQTFDPSAGPSSSELGYYLISLDGIAHFHAFPNPTAPDDNEDYVRLDVYPPHPGWFLAVQNWHNSTVGTYFGYFKVKAGTGETVPFTGGQFLIWSTDGKSYCTAPGRTTVNYQRRPSGDWRTVWAAPLSVVDMRYGRTHLVTPDLSWVTGADWR